MDEELTTSAEAYATRRQLTLAERLGFGIHGMVWVVEGNVNYGRTALKTHRDEGAYEREKLIYLRLQDDGIFEVQGLQVPELIRWDDDLLALEMTIVSPPYLLDFAGAYDATPEFPEDVWEVWENEKRDQFGDLWPAVQMVLAELRSLDIHMLDPSPSNIRFK